MKTFRTNEDSIIDFLRDMIANHVEDESLAQAVLAWMADNPDSDSTADFTTWADGETAEAAAARMTLPGADNVDVSQWIADDDIEARDALLEQAPESYDGLLRQSATVEPLGPNLWRATVRYGLKETDEATGPGETLRTFNFETQEQTVHITQALEPTPAGRRYASSGTAPDFKGVIGYDGEKVAGVDIGTGRFTFSVTKRFTDDEVDSDYLLTLSRNAFRVNDDTFWLWDAGEVLFLGASGSRSGNGSIRESGDDDDQLSGYDGITGLNSENTDSGKLYFTLIKLVGFGNYDIHIYKDSGLTSEVGQSLIASIGSNAVSEVGGSGIGGTITIDQYVQDDDSISVQFPFPWEITFRFAVSRNADDLTVGAMTGIEKEGHEYLWVSYETTDSESVMIQQPAFAYVEKVYETLDFDTLELGESPFA